jgi:hypothetical protein
VGGAHAAYSTGFEHSATAQALCQLGKILFGMNMVQYLGYIVDKNGVHVDTAKIQVIRDWPTLTTLTELQSFLGLANFYQRFMLGFSHIAWALSQVTKGGGRAKFICGKDKQRAFNNLKHRLCSSPVLSLPDLKQPFDVESDAFVYVVGAILPQHWHLVAYHSETLSNTIWKYPTHDKELYSIVKYCHQWKNYIMGKETIIHIDHKPLHFIQTQGKLQNDRHQKWSNYLHQFHLNIKYKTCISNHVTDCHNWPLVATLTTMLHSYGHETSEWPQRYQQDSDFATTYQLLGTSATLTYFHIQDGLLCHQGHLCVPTSEREKMIWEAHYSRVTRHFGIEKTMVIL